MQKVQKIAKNAKSRKKVIKIGPSGSFELFLSVFLLHKFKRSKDTILYNFTQFLPSPWLKNGYPHPFTNNVSENLSPFALLAPLTQTMPSPISLSLSLSLLFLVPAQTRHRSLPQDCDDNNPCFDILVVLLLQCMSLLSYAA
jgi:hypothetical protein